MPATEYRLSPCPFCQSEAGPTLDGNGDTADMVYWVSCHAVGCGSEGPWRKTSEEAVDAWNNRTATESGAHVA